MSNYPYDAPWILPAALDRSAALFADQEALVDDQVRLTWRQVRERVHAIGAAFVASGMKHGDRAAIWAPNIVEWVLMALSAYQVGVVVVPINTRFKGAEAAHVLRTSKARMLFTVTDFLNTDYVAMLRNAGPLPDLEEIVVFRGPAREATVSWSDFQARAAQASPAEVAGQMAQVTPDSIADIIFTSGTTGAPKGAMLSHGSAMGTMITWNDLWGVRSDDRHLIMNPFFHNFGLKGGIISCLLAGAAIIPHAVFDISTILGRIAAERVSIFPGPPAVFQSMLDHPDLKNHDLRSLRLSVTGAAAVPVELIHRMRRELNFELILTAYGMTEASGLVTMCHADDDPETIATTAGRVIRDVEIRLVDDAGAEVPQGEPGEILVRGYGLMKGYVGDPAATAAAIDADGWLKTGDIGVLDANGNLKITDRKKDMFIVGGFNAYPAEIENMISDHPAIGQVAVIGVPDARMGEAGMAYVILRPGAQLDAAGLETWCRSRMANYKVPRHYRFVESFPLNATGKVLKYRLREMARESASEA